MTIEQLENQIRNAFNCNLTLDTLSDEEYEELNSAINKADDATVKRYFPLLLIRDMHTSHKFAFSGTGDHLVYFLDGALLNRSDEKADKGNSRTKDCLIQISDRTFQNFSDDQARAVLCWLKSFALQKYGELCKMDVESAISFWKNKIKRSNK